MSTTTTRSPQEYEDAYEAYYAEAAEEVRAVRVGEKETSEQAAIVARHADLFTQPQLESLRAAEDEATDPDERERLYRLRRACEGGIVDAELAAREDELENALLAARLTFEGEELPLNAAEAKLAVLAGYAQREELGELVQELSASFNDGRRDLLVSRDDLEGTLSGERDAVARNEADKQISLRELETVLHRASDAVDDAYARLRERWFERLLGPDRYRASVECPRRLAAALVAARGDVSQGSLGRRLRRDRPRARVRARRRSRTSASTSKTARRRIRAPA